MEWARGSANTMFLATSRWQGLLVDAEENYRRYAHLWPMLLRLVSFVIDESVFAVHVLMDFFSSAASPNGSD